MIKLMEDKEIRTFVLKNRTKEKSKNKNNKKGI